MDLGLGLSSCTLCLMETPRLLLCGAAGGGASVDGVGSLFPLLTWDTDVRLARIISMIIVLQSQHMLI